MATVRELLQREQLSNEEFWTRYFRWLALNHKPPPSGTWPIMEELSKFLDADELIIHMLRAEGYNGEQE